MYFPAWVSLPTPYTFQLLSFCLFPFFTAVFLGLPSPCDFGRPNCSYKTVVPCSQLNNSFHLKVAPGPVFGIAFKVMKWDSVYIDFPTKGICFSSKPTTRFEAYQVFGLFLKIDASCLAYHLQPLLLFPIWELWHRCCACLLFLIGHVFFLAFF